MMMVKGVTKRIVEIKSPSSDYFERAVLYLKTDRPYPKKHEAVELAEEYLKSLEPTETSPPAKNLRLTVIVLSLSLAAAIAALGAVIVLAIGKW